jgi:hypothetical protein
MLFYSLGYIASNDEFGSIWKVAVVAYYKVLLGFYLFLWLYSSWRT